MTNEVLQTTPCPPGAIGARWRRFFHWLHAHSIRVRLYSVFALLALVVIGLGAIGFARLSDVNRVSEVIRNHWLHDTRVLGDLSNFMSDYRTAEATYLLASTPLELAAGGKEIASLERAVAESQRAYQEIAQAPAEAALYTRFAAQWAAYRKAASRVIALANAGRAEEAVALYNSDSRRSFDLSSDLLGQLTDRTVSKTRTDSARAAATYAHARNMIQSAMLLAAALLIGIILYVTRRLLGPLLDLVACMHLLAEQHTEVVIPGIERHDEIGEMARAVAVFRDNAVALVASQRRLLEQAAALESGLENERRLTAQQRDFLSMTSHEFRTPLTVIDGHAQRLIKTSDRLDPQVATERGTSIRRAVQRITNVMDSLLGASRVLDGQAVFNPLQFDPAVLLRDVCHAHRDAHRGALIVEEFFGMPRPFIGDAQLLFHAFSNLLSNAIKYSPPGSRIELSARHDAGWLEVQVRDHGIGIPTCDRERLFERYFRGSNATGIAGTGVGLHLVAMVVGMHHGSVFAEKPEGAGSRFVVRLPAPLAQSPSEAAERMQPLTNP